MAYLRQLRMPSLHSTAPSHSLSKPKPVHWPQNPLCLTPSSGSTVLFISPAYCPPAGPSFQPPCGQSSKEPETHTMTQWAPNCRCTRKGQCRKAAQPNQWLWSYGEDSRCLHVQSLLPTHHPRQEQGQVRLMLPPACGSAPRPPHPPFLLPALLVPLLWSHLPWRVGPPRSPCLLCFLCTCPRSPCLSPGCPPWLWMNISIVPLETMTAWLMWKGPTWPVSPLPKTSCHLILQAQVRGP